MSDMNEAKILYNELAVRIERMISDGKIDHRTSERGKRYLAQGAAILLCSA